MAFIHVVALLVSLCVIFVPSEAAFLGTLSRIARYIGPTIPEDESCTIYSDVVQDGGHVFCATDVGTDVKLSHIETSIIVEEHNRIRNSVFPKAENMQKLVWDEELALIASKFAKLCDKFHDPSVMDISSLKAPFTIVGMNTYVSEVEICPSQAIHEWEKEKPVFTYNITANNENAKAYVQMITDSVSKVGCGIAFCDLGISGEECDKYIMVCIYVQMMPLDYQKPYCSNVLDECPPCGKLDEVYTNLCDCGGKTCYYNGYLNTNTCECECFQSYGTDTIFTGQSCEFDTCSEDVDNELCDLDYCPDMSLWEVMTFCPEICGLCKACLSCLNGGYLHFGLGEGYICTCVCPGQWTGPLCDQCDISCENSGMLDRDECKCKCPKDFYGHKCEYECRKGFWDKVTAKVKVLCDNNYLLREWCPEACSEFSHSPFHVKDRKECESVLEDKAYAEAKTDFCVYVKYECVDHCSDESAPSDCDESYD